jgi:hypothetical protein
MLSGDSFLDMTHKFMLYKYLGDIWHEAPNGPIESSIWSQLVYDYSATYSPNPDNPPFYVDLPVAWPSGELLQDVWDRWLSFDPVVNVLERFDDLRKLRGIMLDAGSHDDYNLHWGHRVLSHRLTEAGIAHVATENAGNRGVEPTSAIRSRSNGYPRSWIGADGCDAGRSQRRIRQLRKSSASPRPAMLLRAGNRSLADAEHVPVRILEPGTTSRTDLGDEVSRLGSLVLLEGDATRG